MTDPDFEDAPHPVLDAPLSKPPKRKTPSEIEAARRDALDAAEANARESRGLPPLTAAESRRRGELCGRYRDSGGDARHEIGLDIARVDEQLPPGAIPMPAWVREAVFGVERSPQKVPTRESVLRRLQEIDS